MGILTIELGIDVIGKVPDAEMRRSKKFIMALPGNLIDNIVCFPFCTAGTDDNRTTCCNKILNTLRLAITRIALTFYTDPNLSISNNPLDISIHIGIR